jgi:hypothetical protein
MRHIFSTRLPQRFAGLFLFMLLWAGFAPSAQATHFRYGNISWVPIASDATGRTIQFRVSVGYRTSYGWGTTVVPGAVVNDSDSFNFGDGTSTPLNFTVTSVNGPNDYFYAESVITKTYASTGNFTAFFGSCCRISTLQNNSDDSFRVSTVVTVGNNNRAPVATLSPIVNLAAGQSAATFQIPASDPDGDGIAFSLAGAGDQGGISFTQPSGLSISPTGLITFSTVGKSNGQLFNAIAKLTDARGAVVFLDFIIQISGSGNPPTFVYGGITPNNGSTVNGVIGTPVSFTVRATDTDPNDVVAINGVGIPAGASFTPSSGTPTASSPFSFTPSANGTFVLTFTATDLSGGQVQTALTILISPPVSTSNLPPVAPSLPNQIGTVGIPSTLPIPPFTDPNPGQSITYSAAGLPPGCVYVGGSITGTPTTAGVYSVTITGTDVANGTLTGGLSAFAVFTFTITPQTPGGGAFALIAPTYNCATGAFTFNTTGGDGTTITYWAIGVTGPTTNPNDDLDAGLAQDIRDGKTNVQPITLYARQSGVTVTYVWDALAACALTTPPPTTVCGSPTATIGQPLALVAPTYSCATGAIRFNTTGGNGSPIEFMAIGITGWTSSCTDGLDPGNTDNNTYTIMARQNGVMVSLSWTRPCASLRVAREAGSGLTISVLGNPTTADKVEFELRGAEGQTVRLQVVESNGRPVSDLQIEQAGAVERRSMVLGRSGGLYLIRATTPTEVKTVKVMKN